jgi:hypothetical protein
MALAWEHEYRRCGPIVHIGRHLEIKMFSINPSLCDRNKGELRCFLPGFKEDLGEFDSVDEAKARADKVFAYWLEKAGLVEKEQEK